MDELKEYLSYTPETGVKSGTPVVWLDQVLPMYRKDQWKITGVIGMVKSTNHRFRVITIFEGL